jgi:hypothetical protein
MDRLACCDFIHSTDKVNFLLSQGIIPVRRWTRPVPQTYTSTEDFRRWAQTDFLVRDDIPSKTTKDAPSKAGSTTARGAQKLVTKLFVFSVVYFGRLEAGRAETETRVHLGAGSAREGMVITGLNAQSKFYP